MMERDGKSILVKSVREYGHPRRCYSGNQDSGSQDRQAGWGESNIVLDALEY